MNLTIIDNKGNIKGTLDLQLWGHVKCVDLMKMVTREGYSVKLSKSNNK